MREVIACKLPKKYKNTSVEFKFENMQWLIIFFNIKL